MEFGVAAFSAAVTVALSKLCKVKGRAKADTSLIEINLGFLRASMEDHAPNSRNFSAVQTEWIAQVRRLAYDIEDCIDCFHAKKMTDTDFATQIATLENKSSQVRDQILPLAAQQSIMGPVAQGAIEIAQEVAVIPPKLQGVGGDTLSCLLYLCLFPPEHHVRTKQLIRRWMAEGLVLLGEQQAFEKLDNFISSSIINSTQISNNGKVKRCQPTDETLQYISQRSMSEKFILFCDGTDTLHEADARRLSVYPSAHGQLRLPQNLSRLRTLAVFAELTNYEDVLDFKRYRMLRVLDIKECAHMSDARLRAICKQVLMKYLSINPDSIGSITRHIRDLDQLEILDLTGSKTVTVYKEVLLLPKLKHLFGKIQLKWGLFFDWNFKKFLRDDSVLETLAGFVIGDSEGFEQLMSLMRGLSKVKIWCESNASIGNLGHISSAITKFIRDGAEEPNLHRSISIDFENCSRKFVNTIKPYDGGILDSLKLRGHLSEFPQFVAKLKSIVELRLSFTSLSWKKIHDGLSTATGLKYLKLIEDDLGRIDIQPENLKSIERICVMSKKKIDITIRANALLPLESLHILCPDLSAVPGTPGIEIMHMAKLKEITLCPQVNAEIKAKWQDAASGHRNKPVVLLHQDP